MGTGFVTVQTYPLMKTVFLHDTVMAEMYIVKTTDKLKRVLRYMQMNSSL